MASKFQMTLTATILLCILGFVAQGCGGESSTEDGTEGPDGADGQDGADSTDGSDDAGDGDAPTDDAPDQPADGPTDVPADQIEDVPPDDAVPGSFSFLVFGDLNGGGCDRNDRAERLVALMAAEPTVAFAVHTGDLVDGYVSDGQTVCYAADPAVAASGVSACPDGIPNGNMREILAPLKDRTAPAGLAASYYQTAGNHDEGWSDGWYPDPCGGGICDFLAPLTPAAYINHPAGDLCSKEESTSAWADDFYYSFSYQNSYFIVLRLNNDYDNMISSCNGHPGFDTCEEYCSDPALADDELRNEYCYSVEQYDWLTSELLAASGAYEHIFVFAHAILLGSGDNHGPVTGAEYFRALFDTYGVDIFFNGHNHAYERTVRVKGDAADPTGTMYVTVGPGGAAPDYVEGDAFTAASCDDWTGEGIFEEEMTVYTRVTVDGATVTGRVYSLGVPGDPVDEF